MTEWLVHHYHHHGIRRFYIMESVPFPQLYHNLTNIGIVMVPIRHFHHMTILASHDLL